MQQKLSLGQGGDGAIDNTDVSGARCRGHPFQKARLVSLSLKPPDPARKAYVHLVRGELTVNGERLHGGDAALLQGESQIRLDQGADAEVLVFDLVA